MANYVRTFLRHLHNFSTPCGITCGKVIVFHWNLCGFFPKPWENPLWTSCFPPWKRKILLFLGKVIFRQSGTHLIFRKWKNTPTCPGGKPVEKVPFPHFARKNRKKRSGRTSFPKFPNSRIQVLQKPDKPKKDGRYRVNFTFPPFQHPLLRLRTI